MEVSEEQVQAWREMERHMEIMDVRLRAASEMAQREMIRIKQAIRDSDRRAERYLPILRRYGLAPEQRCRCRLR